MASNVYVSRQRFGHAQEKINKASAEVYFYVERRPLAEEEVNKYTSASRVNSVFSLDEIPSSHSYFKTSHRRFKAVSLVGIFP